MTSMMSYAEFITSLMKLIGEQKYYLEATSCTKQYEEDHDLHHHQQEQNWKQRNPHQQNETDRILYSLRRLLEDRYLHLLEKSTKITSLFWNKDTVSASFHHFHDRIKVNNYTFISSMRNSSTTSIADNESTNTCSTTSVTTPSIRTESWIPCTVFMFGYDAIYERINSTTKRCDSAYSPTNLSSQILNDKTFISALQLIVLSRCIAYYLEIRNHCSKNHITSGTKDQWRGQGRVIIYYNTYIYH